MCDSHLPYSILTIYNISSAPSRLHLKLSTMEETKEGYPNNIGIII